MTPRNKIKQLIQKELKHLNMTIAEVHENTDPRVAEQFWAEVCDAWMEYCYKTKEDLDGKYRWDAEFTEFWDIAEKLYPEYVLKPLCDIQL